MSKILENHLYELRALLDRLEPDHIARDRIEGRIAEAKAALRESHDHSDSD